MWLATGALIWLVAIHDGAYVVFYSRLHVGHRRQRRNFGRSNVLRSCGSTSLSRHHSAIGCTVVACGATILLSGVMYFFNRRHVPRMWWGMKLKLSNKSLERTVNQGGHTVRAFASGARAGAAMRSRAAVQRNR
jgi:hypothetical protein